MDTSNIIVAEDKPRVSVYITRGMTPELLIALLDIVEMKITCYEEEIKELPLPLREEAEKYCYPAKREF